MKELGIFSDSEIEWLILKNGDAYLSCEITPMILIDESIPAPLVSEMLEVMPLIDGTRPTVQKLGCAYLANYMGHEFIESFAKDTAPNALADLLIWLKENNKL